MALPAQTDLKDPNTAASADDFLAREKALLGEDAEQFTINDDVLAQSSGDLLGEGSGGQSTFESQFPDLASPSAVSFGSILGHSSWNQTNGYNL